jgi:hypothetical protein
MAEASEMAAAEACEAGQLQVVTSLCEIAVSKSNRPEENYVENLLNDLMRVGPASEYLTADNIACLTTSNRQVAITLHSMASYSLQQGELQHAACSSQHTSIDVDDHYMVVVMDNELDENSIETTVKIFMCKRHDYDVLNYILLF